jgi:hypothetical protein
VKPVQRDDIVDYQTYEELRPAFREEVMAAKSTRRVHVGDHLTFLFENPLTIRYQIQEMMRAERIVREKEIRHEIDTYNGLLGGDGELGCTLLVEIDDPGTRDAQLTEWFALPEHLYVLLEDGRRIRPAFDEGQRGRGRLSSVQYLKFAVEGRVPVAVGTDLPGLQVETPLTEAQRAALGSDLKG